MTSPRTLLKTGLTSSQIKMIAVIFMTIDHIAAYGSGIPVVMTCYYKLRQLGRIAAPLFLYMVTEGIRHTGSRRRYILRLYAGAVGCGLFNWVTNILFADQLGQIFYNSILFDFFYTAIYIVSIEQIVHGVQNREWKKGLLGVSGILLTYIIQLLFNWVVELQGISQNLHEFVMCFLAGPKQVQYSLSFVLMGILFYFIRPKWGKAMVLVLFASICLRGGTVFYRLEGTFLEPLTSLNYIGMFTSSMQSRMALAAPFMLLYNGQRGRGSKYFFYIYYPTHIFVIRVLAALILGTL